MLPFHLRPLLACAALTLALTSEALAQTQPIQQSVTVNAANDALQPDPSAQAYRREDLLDANPTRPGVPLSIPGYPAETASGGIKAPQYFAPGVAGDHGEPIAQYIAVGGLLLPNNLTANAHGNGYADPNLLIPATLEGVVVDNAAFNALYGDHAINLAVTYGLRTHLSPYLQFSTDTRDSALSAGTGSANQWLAAEVLWGNGWLARPEHRQQTKITGLRQWTPTRHTITLLGLGYEGFSHIPGLIPLDVPVPGETVDERQQDFTHTELAALTDTWTPTPHSTLRYGAWARRYGLDLRSNFGDGLIRQSEHRWLEGGSLNDSHTLPHALTLLAGLDLRRDQPRELSLEHALDSTNTPEVPGNLPTPTPTLFTQVTLNNLTLTTTSPFAALTAHPFPFLQLYAGLRHDTICFHNQDLVTPANSFDRCPGQTSPKLNLTLGHIEHADTLASYLPQLAISYARAFHANDPRIGPIASGINPASLLISAHEWQLVASKQILGQTELRLTLARVANADELAKIDADTGLQQDQGPALNRYLTLALRRRTNRVFWQATWSAADARTRLDGLPVPEAPRMIADATASISRLPLNLTAQAEFEYVKAKPLGDAVTGLPLRELRLALRRTFLDDRLTAALRGQLVEGFSGQTTETLALPNEPNPFERAVGVPAASYASASITWRLR